MYTHLKVEGEQGSYFISDMTSFPENIYPISFSVQAKLAFWISTET